MKPGPTIYLSVACYLVVCSALSAEQIRFTGQIEASIPIAAREKEVTARLWTGKTQLMAPNATRADIQAIAVYLADSKLLWWSITYATPPAKPWPIDEWKRRFHCGATEAAIVCFWSTGGLEMRQVSLKIDGSDIAAAVGQIVSKLSPDSVQREFMHGYETINLASIREQLNQFYDRRFDVSALSKPDYFVTKVVPIRGGWEIYIEETDFGQIAAIRLDDSLHPVSARMIKSHQ